MEWQEGGGPHENVSVLGPQNVNYGHKDIEMEEEEEEPQLADDDLTIDVFNFPQTFFHLTLNRTKSFKHKQHDLVNEQLYCHFEGQCYYRSQCHFRGHSQSALFNVSQFARRNSQCLYFPKSSQGVQNT